jgi:hypothetical protein
MLRQITMSNVYMALRWINRRWILIALFLVSLTMLVGLWGIAIMDPKDPVKNLSTDKNEPLNLQTEFYHTLKLFTLDTSLADGNVNVVLEVARWLGAFVWSFAILTILIAVFYERAVTSFVWICSHLGAKPVIVAGLGSDDESRVDIVRILRKEGRNVVVLEPDGNHPSLGICRDAGALCLTGSAREPSQLNRIGLRRASCLLALGPSDSENVEIGAVAAEMLSAGKGSKASGEGDEAEDLANNNAPDEAADPLAPLAAGEVTCVVEVSQPGVLHALRRHNAHRSSNHEKLRLSLMNRHELMACAMIREWLVGHDSPPPTKILIVGIGREGRLAEALIVRAAKDRFIERTEGIPDLMEPLAIDVIDNGADEWVKCVTGRHTHLSGICGVRGFNLSGSQWPMTNDSERTGWCGVAEECYDAVMICLPDEGHAIMQALQIQKLVSSSTPIVVRVRSEQLGFAKLLHRQPKHQFGEGTNIRVAGMQDRAMGVALSMNPMIEMMAQIIHQDYLATSERKRQEAIRTNDLAAKEKVETKAAFKSWTRLHWEYHMLNRLAAERLVKHLVVRGPDGTAIRRYRHHYSPDAPITPLLMFPPASPKEDRENDEINLLAKSEHDLWMESLVRRGWRIGHRLDENNRKISDPDRKLHPDLKPWEDLDEGTQDYDRSIIRRLPYVFAKADEQLVLE